MNHQTKIVFVVPDESMIETVHQAWALHERIFGEMKNAEYSIDV